MTSKLLAGIGLPMLPNSLPKLAFPEGKIQFLPANMILKDNTKGGKVRIHNFTS